MRDLTPYASKPAAEQPCLHQESVWGTHRRGWKIVHLSWCGAQPMTGQWEIILFPFKASLLEISPQAAPRHSLWGHASFWVIWGRHGSLTCSTKAKRGINKSYVKTKINTSTDCTKIFMCSDSPLIYQEYIPRPHSKPFIYWYFLYIHVYDKP